MPKYPAIRQTLKDRLISSEYPPGQALPNEHQLALDFGVSRMTLRRAVEELEHEGYLYRVQGAGTYPTGQRFPQGQFPVSFFSELERLPDIRTRVVRALNLQATPEMAQVLELAAGAPVYFLERLRLQGEKPLALEKRYLNAALLPNFLAQALDTPSLHDLMVRQGVPISRLEQELAAVSLRQDEAAALQLAPGSPAFLLRRTTLSGRGRERVSFTNYWFRADHFTPRSAFDL